jgi:riboflavin transporter FmnP
MITWAFITQLAMLGFILYVVEGTWKKDSSAAAFVVGIILTAFFSVPVIYIFGWLLLPAYGIGPFAQGVN